MDARSPPPDHVPTFWVYIIQCADGSYYTGHTDDIDLRLAQHQQGAFADCHTFSRRPVRLVYSQAFDNRDAAVRAERRIKGWRREKKEALIAGRFDLLQALARSRAGGPGASGEVPAGGRLLFAADDGTNGIELWKSDGTEAGTVLVKDVAPGQSTITDCP